MKKILTIILLAIGLTAYSQQTLRKGFVSIQNNDTVWLTYNAGIWTFESDTTLVISIDTIYFADGSYQATKGVGTVDTLYHSDTEIWLNSGDTIPKADSARYETNTTVANIDTLEFANGSRLTDIPQNNIFLWDSTNSNYEPYASFQAGSHYYGSSNPTGDTRYNLDFTLVPYNVWAVAVTTALGNGVIQGTYTGSSLGVSGVRGVASNGGIGVNAETAANGGIALVANSISSDEINSAFIHNLDTILKITADSVLAELLVLKSKVALLDTLIADVINLNGTEIDTIIQLKEAVENEIFDSINIGYVIRFNESEGVHEFITAKDGVIWQGALEDLFQFYNNTGQTIDNFTPLYYSGVNGDSILTCDYATSAIRFTVLRYAGMSTGSVPNGSWGFGNRRGKIREANTSLLSQIGTVFLGSDSLPTMTKPAYPNEVLVLGGVIEVGADGIFYHDPSFVLRRQLKTKSYSFTSSNIASGTFWDAGFYDYSVTDITLDEASPDEDYGIANIAYEAHPFAVYGGAGSVTGGGRVALITTGTSIDGSGTQTASDPDTLLNDITNAVLNEYNETQKYLGTVTYQLVVVEGAPSAYSLDFNYGYAKYDDVGDRDFYITGLECTWRGSQTDATGFDIELLFHRATGWTYNASAFVAGDGTIAKRSTDQAGFLGVLNGQQSAWKRTDLNTFLNGSDGEGFIWKISTGANSTIQVMNMHVEVALDN